MNQERPIWQRTRAELLRDLDCSEDGLSSQEAAARLEQHGPNELQSGKQKSIPRIFAEQFADFLVIILILAAIVSAILGDVENTVVILAVITMNAILGTVQTVKASASLDSLKRMSAPTAKVLRDGKVLQIPGREVTVGDVVSLEAGDSVCADGRLLECASLKCAESALTGESLPVEKDLSEIAGDVPLGDRRNMVFSGSFVTYGRAKFLVTAIGMDTEMGKIASAQKHGGEKDSPAGESGSVWEKALHWDSCDLRGAFLRQRVPAAGKSHERLPLRRRPGRGSHPGGALLHCHHRALLWHTKNGPGKCYHSQAPGRGGFGQCVRDLF